MTAEDMNKDDDLGSEGSDEGARPGETEDDAKSRKRKERLEQNRISARESRKRKKTMIEELQRTVITLSRENKDLNERNETLRRNLMEIGAKVRHHCPVHIQTVERLHIASSSFSASFVTLGNGDETACVT